jgi:hypothetical protein
MLQDILNWAPCITFQDPEKEVGKDEISEITNWKI